MRKKDTYSKELALADDQNKWLISLLENLHEVDGNGLEWCISGCGICTANIGMFLGIAICKELNIGLEVEEDWIKLKGLPYGLNALPRGPEFYEIQFENDQATLNYILSSMNSLSENIKKIDKFLLDKIDYNVCNFSSRKEREKQILKQWKEAEKKK
jgi:hypothetical protein